MNSHIHYEGYNYRLTPEKAPKLFSDFDVILDCTDRQSSRYFISDAAVVARKPLVHASALGTVGQFMVLNNPPSLVDGNAHQGPCYRCIFPKPMRPENSRSCAEAGVLGPVVGVMGILMAMEAIKLLTQPKSTPWYMIYNAYSKEPFKILNLNRKNQNCVACSEKCTVTKELLESGSLDYDEFCGGRVNYDVLEDHQRMSVRDCKRLMDSKPQQHVLVDLRDKVQFDIGHVKGSINLPISTIYQSPDAGLGALGQKLDFQPTLGRNPTLHFICRYGNDSRLALRQILDSQRIWEHGTLDYGRRRYLIGRDVIGGYDAWRKEIDPWLPDY
jgi:adenylyltransferase/sulfurtransferase